MKRVRKVSNSIDQQIVDARAFGTKLVAQRELTRAVNRRLSNFELNVDLWLMLDSVAQREQRPTSIADQTGLTAVQVSRGANELVDHGYVISSRDQTDKRASILAISDRGRSIHRESARAIANVCAGHTDELRNGESKNQSVGELLDGWPRFDGRRGRR